MLTALLDSDYDFLIALGVAAALAAAVVVLSLVASYRRARTTPPAARASAVAEPAAPAALEPRASEPVFFRRYTGEGVEPRSDREQNRAR